MKVGVGLMCRHCVVRKELAQKIKDGAIGDLNAHIAHDQEVTIHILNEYIHGRV